MTNNPNILKMVEHMNTQIEKFYGIDCSEEDIPKEQYRSDWEREQQHDWDRDRKQSFEKWRTR
ncbi:MAG: hypothetical protein WC917_00640 [Bacilli bacterium]